MQQVLDFLNMVSTYLSAHSSVVGSFLGMIFVLAKITPTSASGKVMGSIQKVIDFIASIFEVLGHILKAVSDLIASIIKSDGAGGTP